MNLKINREKFLKEIKIIKDFIINKNITSILSGVKIKTENNGIYIIANNMETSIEIFLDKNEFNIEIIKTGKIIIQFYLFYEILKKMYDKNIEIKFLENINQIIIISEKINFKLNNLNFNIFPILKTKKKEFNIEILSEKLNDLINKTKFSISSQESRPILTGINLIIKNNKILMISTDSHRLNKKIDFIENKNLNINVVIPGKSLIELSKIINSKNKNLKIKIFFMKNQIFFKIDNIKFFSRFLEGRFPETSNLIPKKFSTEIVLNSFKFFSAIQRISFLSHEYFENIIQLIIKKEKSYLYGNFPEIGEFKEEIEIEKFSGKPLKINFNPDYLNDALKIFNKNENIKIKIKFVSNTNPFLIKKINLENKEENDFLQLITPIRIN